MVILCDIPMVFSVHRYIMVRLSGDSHDCDATATATPRPFLNSVFENPLFDRVFGETEPLGKSTERMGGNVNLGFYKGF